VCAVVCTGLVGTQGMLDLFYLLLPSARPAPSLCHFPNSRRLAQGAVYVYRSPLPLGTVSAESSATWWAQGGSQHARLGLAQPLLGNMTLPSSGGVPTSVLLLSTPYTVSSSVGEMAGTAGLYVCSA
jgi:hypothetical protein